MTDTRQMAQEHNAGSAKYIAGFIIAVILTLAAFLPVMNGWMSGWSPKFLVAYLLGLALIQMLVQIVFFLHLGEGADAKYNVLAMWVAVGCVFVIIAGTWWAMWHLNYQVLGGAGRVEQSDVIYSPTGDQIAPDATTLH